jgi:hypothetical protein
MSDRSQVESEDGLYHEVGNTHRALLMTGFIIAGLVVAGLAFPAEWPIIKRVVGGVFLGVGSAFCVYINRFLS